MKSDATQRDSVPSSKSRPWLAALVLGLSIAIVYGQALSVPFIFDDVAAITKNRSITSLWPLAGTETHRGPLNPPPQTPTSARPLVNLSFALNYASSGLSPTAFHVVNVVIHFLSALLLWSITHRTLRLQYFAGRFERSADWLALVVALVWALHPIQTEAVIYATQRTELMFAFFYLATIDCSLRYLSAIPLPLREACGEHGRTGLGEGSSQSHQSRNDRSSERSRAKGRTPAPESRGHVANSRARTLWLCLAVLSCAAGMASKEVMVSAPLIVLLYDRTFIAGSLPKAVRRSWPLYAGLLATWILLIALNHGAPRSQSAGFNLDVTGYSWWLTQTKVLLLYLKLLVWPFPLLIHYEFDYFKTFAEAWPYAIPVILLGLGTLLLLWRNSPIGFLGTTVFAILSPTLLIPIVTEMAAERRMYLPLAAIAALVIVGGYQLAQRAIAKWHVTWAEHHSLNAAKIMPAAVLIVALGWVSADRLQDYYDEPNLWQDVLRYYPKDFMVQSYRGNWLAKSGKPEEAIDAYLASLRHTPDDVEVLNNLAVVLMRTNRIEEGIATVQKALQLQPSSVDARMTLGLLYKRAGRLPEAVEELKASLAPYPDDVEIRNYLGETLFQAQRFPEAIEQFQAATRLKPSYTEAHFSLAQTLAAVGKTQEAVAAAQKAVEVARSNGQAEAAAQIEKWLEQFQSQTPGQK
jgi:tetratricopeptide (TPR) repeat protein